MTTYNVGNLFRVNRIIQQTTQLIARRDMPDLSVILSLLKDCNERLTKRKRSEGFSPPKFTILVQKVMRVEGVWSLPHQLIM